MIALILVLIVLAALAVFAVVGGAFLFNALFVRKENASSQTIQSLETALAQMRKSADGEKIDGVKMFNESFEKNKAVGIDALSAHVNDPRIMIPILEAKIRWLKKLDASASAEVSADAGGSASASASESAEVLAKAGSSASAGFGTIEKVFVTGERGTKLAGYFVSAGASASEKASASAGTSASEKASASASGSANADSSAGANRSASAHVALLVHGYTDSAAGMAYLAEEYLSRGVSVLAVDCRAHGNSEGSVMTMGYTDSRDVAAWLMWLSQKFGNNVKIIMHGVSMGAASVIQVSALEKVQPLAGNLALIVADCSFSSMPEQLTGQIELVIGKGAVKKILAKIMIAGMSFVNFLLGGFFFGANSPVHALEKRQHIETAKVPLLLFHGENDALVPPYMSQKLEKANGSCQVKVVRVPNAPHIGSYFYAQDLYMSEVFDFLD